MFSVKNKSDIKSTVSYFTVGGTQLPQGFKLLTVECTQSSTGLTTFEHVDIMLKEKKMSFELHYKLSVKYSPT